MENRDIKTKTMKVRLIPIASIAWAALAVCSCSDTADTTPEPQQPAGPLTAITFSAAQPQDETVTRAGGRGLEEVLTGEKTFQVWGYKNDGYDSANDTYTSYQTVMPNFTVNWAANTAYTTTSNTNNWEYVGQGATAEQQANQTIKYWDWSVKAYRFFGYALGNATATPATQPVAVTVANGTVAATPSATEVTFTATVDASTQAGREAAPYFSRLWFSTGNPTDYPDRQFGHPVELQFLKPFARVRVMFTYAKPEITRTNISSLSFAPTGGTSKIPQSGTVTIHYPLKGEGTMETYSATFASADESSALTAITQDYYECSDSNDPAYALREYWYYVVPRTTQGSYTMTINIFGDEKSVVVPEPYMQWKPGYEYTYIFKITEGGSLTLDVIQVAIDQWITKGEVGHTVYNW